MATDLNGRPDPFSQVYKGYFLAPSADGTVAVLHPHRLTTPLYVGTDTKDAQRFVRGYRDGVFWAMQAAL